MRTSLSQNYQIGNTCGEGVYLAVSHPRLPSQESGVPGSQIFGLSFIYSHTL